MSHLSEILYPVPDYRRTPISLLLWWESRRLLFNSFVGAAGLVTLAAVFVLFSLPPDSPGVDLRVSAFITVAYGVAANLCYTLGWILELLMRRLWGSEAPDVGPILFRQGLIFSVGLTLFPIALAALFWLFRLASHVA